LTNALKYAMFRTRKQDHLVLWAIKEFSSVFG
jgi:hypothetical protein